MYIKENNDETYDEYVENLKKKTLRVVYRLETLNHLEPAICETTLISVKGTEILKLQDAIKQKNSTSVMKWRDPDDVVMIWGRLKSNLPVEVSCCSTQDDIDFVKRALNGCEESQDQLKNYALHFVLGQPFLNHCGTIYCTDIKLEKENEQHSKEFNDELNEWKALVK